MSVLRRSVSISNAPRRSLLTNLALFRSARRRDASRRTHPGMYALRSVASSRTDSRKSDSSRLTRVNSAARRSTPCMSRPLNAYSDSSPAPCHTNRLPRSPLDTSQSACAASRSCMLLLGIFRRCPSTSIVSGFWIRSLFSLVSGMFSVGSVIRVLHVVDSSYRSIPTLVRWVAGDWTALPTWILIPKDRLSVVEAPVSVLEDLPSVPEEPASVAEGRPSVLETPSCLPEARRSQAEARRSMIESPFDPQTERPRTPTPSKGKPGHTASRANSPRVLGPRVFLTPDFKAIPQPMTTHEDHIFIPLFPPLLFFSAPSISS
jgi:hypothetical protein